MYGVLIGFWNLRSIHFHLFISNLLNHDGTDYIVFGTFGFESVEGVHASFESGLPSLVTRMLIDNGFAFRAKHFD